MTQTSMAGAPATGRPVVCADPGGVRLSVEVREMAEFAAADAASVEALLDARPGVGVFLSNAWLSGLFAHPPKGYQPSMVVLREGSEVRGLVPIAVRRGPRHARVTLLGGGFGSDRIDLVAARGCEPAAATALLDWLVDSFGCRFVLELRDVPADSALWGAVYRVSRGSPPRVMPQPREVHTLPYLDLAELWSSTAGRGPEAWHPPSLAKHRRWLERRGQLQIELLDDGPAVLEAFDTLTGLLHARWGNEGGSVLDQPRAQRFHRCVLPLLLRQNQLRMIRLTAGSRAVAVFYGLARGAWWGYYLAGYDREWAGRIQLGRITLAAAIDLAARHGAAEFDFLKGAHQVKYGWPVRERATIDADVYARGPAAQASRAVWAARETAAALARSAFRR